MAVRNHISDKLVEAGYLDKSGNVDLNLFKKNTKGSIDTEDLISRLKNLGIIDEQVSLKEP